MNWTGPRNIRGPSDDGAVETRSAFLTVPRGLREVKLKVEDVHDWDEVKVLEHIRRRAVAGKPLGNKAVRRDHRPLLDAAIRYFEGGWATAIEAAAAKWPQIKAIQDAAARYDATATRPATGDAAKLRACRVAAKLTQAALARLTGDRPSDISNMEAGRVGVQQRVWAALGLDGPPAEAPAVTPPAPSRGRPPRPIPTRKVQVVLTPEAWTVWERWVKDGIGSASMRVSALIAAAGGKVEVPTFDE